MSNSPLVVYVDRSPYNSGQRNHDIDMVAIHCMAGNLTIETCGQVFHNRQASSNYGIGSDGRIALYVDECNRSWCTSSRAVDNRAVTIEVANIEACEPYRITEAAYDSLIALLVDICKRNGIPELRWLADPDILGEPDKQNMMVHRWFEPTKSCPGNWLFYNQGRIADEVNTILRGEDELNWDDVTRDMMLEKIGDKFIETIDDVPKWAEKDVRQLLDDGIINGGTDAETDPDDINMFFSDIKSLIAMRRMIERY